MYINCGICLKAFRDHLVNGLCESCTQDLIFNNHKKDDANKKPQPPKHKGWECPKCLAVMAPHRDNCINCLGTLSSKVNLS